MKEAAATTIFEKILRREIPCDKIYEDDHCLAFRDINPQAPVHVLVIPKTRITNLLSAKPEHREVLGALLLGAAAAARKLGLEQSGYRLVMNNGPDGGQSVDYLHCHILGGRAMSWPPG